MESRESGKETNDAKSQTTDNSVPGNSKYKIPTAIVSIVIIILLIIWLANSCGNEKTVTEPIPQTESQIDNSENKAWSDAVTINTLAGYQAYLRDFKNGIHVEEAQKKIDEIEDDDDWQTALTNNTKAAYQEYLQNRPKGKWANDANKKIDELEQLAQQRQEKANANKARLAEDEDWNTAKSTNTLESYQIYQDKYPTGRYKSEAAKQIASIQKATKKRRWQDPRDGAIYKTIRIGDQVWMAENLKATKFNDGTTIDLAENSSAWANLSTPAYSWYDNNEKSGRTTYGALYNWYAVNTGKLCPVGWHVSTDEDWDRLVNLLSGKGRAGGRLKMVGTTHWKSPNSGATNESGFSALPGGHRYANGRFWFLGIGAIWWSVSESDSSQALSHHMFFNNTSVERTDMVTKGSGPGYSVRCVKD